MGRDSSWGCHKVEKYEIKTLPVNLGFRMWGCPINNNHSRLYSRKSNVHARLVGQSGSNLSLIFRKQRNRGCSVGIWKNGDKHGCIPGTLGNPACGRTGGIVGDNPRRRGAVAVEATAVTGSMVQSTISTYMETAIEHGILGATVRGSLRLGMICLVVGWLLKLKKIPKETSEVLSKVAFNICVPSMLFTNVAKALVRQNDLMLLWIPVAAFIQIGLGFFIGLGAAHLMERGAFFLPSNRTTSFVQKTKASPAIASSTAMAFGNPMAASALVPKSSQPPEGFSRVVMVACMFGNSFTMPLVYMFSLLPASLAASTPAYVAMFLAGWSPLFWGVGYNMVKGAANDNEGVLLMASNTVARPISERSTESLTTGYGSSGTLVGQMRAPTTQQWRKTFLSSLSQMQTQTSQLWRSLSNPPIIAVLIGCFVGCTPIGKILFSSTLAEDIASMAPGYIGAALGAAIAPILDTALSVLELFSEGTLAFASIILAASIFAKFGDSKKTTSQPWWKQMIPTDIFEQRALLLVSIARFVIMPVIGIISVIGLSLVGALPWDPVCHLLLLTQSTMPPPQNLVLLMNLRDETRHLVPQVARFLIRMYILSIVPITIWTAIFTIFTGVELS